MHAVAVAAGLLTGTCQHLLPAGPQVANVTLHVSRHDTATSTHAPHPSAQGSLGNSKDVFCQALLMQIRQHTLSVRQTDRLAVCRLRHMQC
jgi:hypothetical protein